MSAIKSLKWADVRAQYDIREQVHDELLLLHGKGKKAAFADLLLGISDSAGNYGAAEHGLGPRILAENYDAQSRLLKLADQFLAVKTGHEVPAIIRAAGLKYLQVGVGSEASCMINPTICWIANVRTIWTHLVIKHGDNFYKAAQELTLYREADASSEMMYSMWTVLHRDLEPTMTLVADEGTKLAISAKVNPGTITYLWADAIANELYDNYYDK
jgi:hypothetical protein